MRYAEHTRYDNGGYLFLFALLFYSGMSLSSYLHPLWFSQQGRLENFGIAYTLMALAGGSSFLLGKYLAHISLRNGLLLGSFLYSLGLLLRIYTDVWVVIISSLIAGIGASTILLCLSSWPFSAPSEQRKNFLYSRSLTGQHTGKGFVIMSIGLMLLLYHQRIQSVSLMIIASFFPVIAYILCKNHIPLLPSHRETVSHVWAKRALWYSLRHLIAYSIISGVCVSFLLPYVPFILQQNNLSQASILIVLGMASTLSAFAQSVVVKRLAVSAIYVFFTFSLIIWVCSTLLLGSHSSSLVIIAVIVNFIASSFVAYAKRVIEMKIISPQQVQYSMGILQSSFLVGSMLGGSIAGLLWSNNLSAVVLLSVASLELVSGLYLLMVCARASTQSSV